MEKDLILNGNKLIAEFMGIKFKNHDYNRVPKGVFNSSIRHILDSCNSKHLQFHELWDWLMPVVEKIEDIMANWNRSNYNKGYKYWMSKFKGSFFYIDELYKNVVEFITWYNKNS